MSDKTTITVTKDLRKELSDIAKKQNRTIIGFIRYLLEKEKREQKA